MLSTLTGALYIVVTLAYWACKAGGIFKIISASIALPDEGPLSPWTVEAVRVYVHAMYVCTVSVYKYTMIDSRAHLSFSALAGRGSL